MRGTRVLVVIVAATAALAAAWAPVASAKPPAVDEYTLNLPGAGGPKHPKGDGKADPSKLDPDTAEELDSPADEPLVAIATDPDLGAPVTAPTDSGAGNAGGNGNDPDSGNDADSNDDDAAGPASGNTGSGTGGSGSAAGASDSGFVTAAASTFTEGGIPWLMLGLLAVLGLAIVAGRRRSD